MKIKQTIVAFVAVAALLFLASPIAFAQTECAGVDTAIIECPDAGDDTQQTGVWYLLILALNILTAGVGIAAVGGMVYAAILYASARQQADQVKKAKDIILNIIIGLVAYAGMYLVVNFLIPGGLFT